MGSSKKSNSNILVQGSILAMASIICRIIGIIYRLPMTSIIGDIGNNYYGCAFDIYNVMLIISSYSLPLAVSKLVSARRAKGEYKMIYQIFKGALLFALVSGTTVALIVYFGAEFFTDNLLKTPFSIVALQVLAPALVVVAVLGVLRGFFQGLGTMMPSAVSQIIEQIVNAIVSVWAAYVLYGYGTRIGAIKGDKVHYAAAYGAAGGTLGTNLGSVAALIFVVFIFAIYVRVLKKQMRKDRHKRMDSFGYVMKILIITIIPVLMSTTMYNISGIIDQGIFKNIALSQGYNENDIEVWWGVFSGKYKLLINVPISIASAMAASSVPALTASYASKDFAGVKNQINISMRFVMVLAFPCAVGLGVLAKPIFTLLFSSQPETIDLATTMMWAGAIAVIFYAMSTLSNGLLQGINRLIVPVINAIIAIVAHVILLVVLMLVFKLNIYAVIWANTFFAFLMCILNSIAIKKYIGYQQEIKKTFVIPIVASAIMGLASYGVYYGLFSLIKNNTISFIFAFIVAVVVYAVVLLLFKGLTEEELLGFPKGQLIVSIAKKIHLL